MKNVAVSLLAISLAANAWLIWDRDNNDSTVSANATSQPVFGNESRNVARTQLVVSSEIGDAREQAKLSMLASLEAEAESRLGAVSRQYWRTDDGFEEEYVKASIEVQEFIRDSLRRAFGTEAENDVLFHRIFKPMGPMFSFLSSEQQIAIQRLKLERDLQTRNAMRGGNSSIGPQMFARQDNSAIERIAADYQAELERILDEAELYEYLLRESPVAQRLRSSGVELTEQEFRAVFTTLSELAALDGGVDAALAARTELNEILGTRRFARLWSTQDPKFFAINSIAKEHDLSDEAVLSVYEIFVVSEDEKMRTAALAQIDPDRAAVELRAISERERQQVARLVGEQIADEIFRGQAAIGYQWFSDAAKL